MLSRSCIFTEVRDEMFAVIRLRGSGGQKKGIKDTLDMLRLFAVNNCVIVPETENYRGMLEKCRNVCTWGEVEKDLLVKLLEERLRGEGDKKIDEKILKELTGFDSFGKLAEALMADKTKLKDLKKIVPMFRLSPPSKGFKSVKEYYPKGDLGYRGKEINKLLERMI